MSATDRLAATARTTGRGAFRNCRHRISAHDRCRIGRSSVTAEDRERPTGGQRLRRVTGKQLDAPEEPVELRLRREEPDADPERVDERDGAGDREHPCAELL